MNWVRCFFNRKSPTEVRYHPCGRPQLAGFSSVGGGAAPLGIPSTVI